MPDQCVRRGLGRGPHRRGHDLRYGREQARVSAPRHSRSKALIGALVAAVVAATVVSAAGAGTTISPLEAGNVVRDDVVKIEVNPGGFTFTRTFATSNFTRQSPLGLTSSCKGDNPAGTNNSPRSMVTVT